MAASYLTLRDAQPQLGETILSSAFPDTLLTVMFVSRQEVTAAGCGMVAFQEVHFRGEIFGPSALLPSGWRWQRRGRTLYLLRPDDLDITG